MLKNLLPHVDHSYDTWNGSAIAGPYMPNGFASPQPNTPKGGTSFYKGWESKIYGFAQAHVHGTGGQGNYGWIMFMPQTGVINTDWKTYLSSKANEVLDVDYYSVEMPEHKVRTRITPAHNSSLYRFDFSGNPAHLVVDISYMGTADLNLYEGGCHSIHAQFSDDGRVVSGAAVYSGGWGTGLKERDLFFYIEQERAPQAFGTWNKEGMHTGERKLIQDNGSWSELWKAGHKERYVTASHAGIYFTVADSTKPVHVKIGLSKRSVENARYFAQHQIDGFDFEGTRAVCRKEWNRRLSRILVEGPDDDVRAFYTFLHHTWVMPRLLTGDDPYGWNTDYWDDQYSTWDTFRSLYPLKSLIDQEMMAGAANFLTRCQEEFGYIPRHMVNGVPWNGGLDGDTGDDILTEALLKQIPGVDVDRAYAALKGAAFDAKGGRRKAYLKDNRGWMPVPWDGVLTGNRRPGGETVHNNTVDARLAVIASMRGEDETARILGSRSQGWTNLWNPDAVDEDESIRGFMTPRYEDGTFIPVRNEKLDRAGYGARYGEMQMPEWINVRQIAGNFFGEGHYWTYSLLVNHDPLRLIEKCGGPDAFVRRMEVGYENRLMGLGNQPGFFIPWLACYAGRPDVTAKWARHAAIGRRLHKVYDIGSGAKGGYGGSEDSGAMSSWWIFWSMGLFPNAGSDVYLLHGPFLPRITIQLENGRDFIIEGEGAGETSPYVQSCEFNGKPWNQCWIRHRDIMNGGTLKFTMGPEPSKWAQNGRLPPSFSTVSR